MASTDFSMTSLWDYYIAVAQSKFREIGLSGGKPLNDSEKAQLQAQVNADIDRAAAGNTELALEQKAQAAQDLAAVHKQYEDQYNANSIWSELSSTLASLGPYWKWLLIGIAVLFGLSLLVKIKNLFE